MPDRAREAELRRRFDEAMELPAAEREGYVDAVTDELLRERLRALVRQDERPTTAALHPQLPAGQQRIGDYELLRVLGSGGMGVVFLGLQMEPVERLVAVKRIAEDGGDADARQRFGAEQHALIRMNHPGIARVFDVGVTDDGAPFLAMEYVRGEPLDVYCDRRRLDVAARVRLMVDVCDAAQHAHQKGVIHRDLKPANILVSERDGEVQPKVIDFGLARATAGRLAHMRPTTPGMLVGTLQYMSPEQAGGGQDVDTRTDVYALGAVLHELLCGAPPLALGDDEGAVLRFRADLEAGKLPGMVRTARALSPEAADGCAAARSTSSAAWLRELGSDLSPIVGKALATERTRRYATASELGADLERWARGEPVTARKPTVGYLASRFVRRNRVAVLAATAALALVVGFGVTAWLEKAAAQAARDEAVEARMRLQQAVGRAEAIRAFTNFVELYGDPGLGADAPSLRQSLHKAAPIIAVRWGDRPLLRSAVRRALGRALLALGDPAAAMAELRQAWRDLEPVPEVDPGWATQVLADLSRAERQAGDVDASRKNLAALLRLGALGAQADGPALAEQLRAVEASVVAQRFDQAVQQLEQALAALRSHTRDEPVYRIAGPVIYACAVQLFRDGVSGSEALIAELEVVIRGLLGEDIEFASALVQLGELRLDMNQDRAVVELAGEVLSMSSQLGLEEHWLVAQAERQLGLASALAGDGARGEADLLALHRRLVEFSEAANERVQAAIAAPRELCERLASRGQLDAFLQQSFARWRAAPEQPWWPVADAGCATRAALEAALIIAGEGGADAPVAQLDALCGAALLHLGRIPAAVERLQAAVAGVSSPSPELLADLAVALHRAADRDAAVAAVARLRTAAEGRTDTRWRRASARVDALR